MATSIRCHAGEVGHLQSNCKRRVRRLDWSCASSARKSALPASKQKLAEPLIESRDACVGLDTRIDRRGAQRWPLLILSPLLRDQLTGHQPIIYIYIYATLVAPRTRR